MATLDNTINRRRITQSFLLVWADANINSIGIKNQTSLKQCQSIINDVQFTDQPQKAIELLHEANTEKSFLITCGSFGQDLVPYLHDIIEHLDAIYILCQDILFHQRWSRKWNKVHGVYNCIDSICDELKKAVRQCNQDKIAMSFVDSNNGDEGPSSDGLNQLEPSFMYSILLKETIIKMEHNTEEELITFKNNVINKYVTKKIDAEQLELFIETYQSNEAIQWYSKQLFLYPLLNDALRFLEGDIIVDMAFFINDLHHQIQQLHDSQSIEFDSNKFDVYRGQALSFKDFEHLKNNTNDLLCFNNFLLTTRNRDVAVRFAENGSRKSRCVGVLFQITIDPRLIVTPFADVSHLSSYPHDAEILFSMHTVCRIIDVRSIRTTLPLYQIDLVLISDDDFQLDRLIEQMDASINSDYDWYRLAWILMDMNHLDKCKEIYLDLLKKNPSSWQESLYNSCLGMVNDRQGRYQEALEYYQKGFDLQKQVLPDDHPDLATAYNHIGVVYMNMKEYTNALMNYQQALTIYKKTLPDTHTYLAISYGNIGLVYWNMGEYWKAMSNYEEALAIQKRTLPPTHPNLVSSYGHLGLIYSKLGRYLEALLNYEQALAIQKKMLPDTHPYLATSYENIARVYSDMGEYSKTLLHYQQALNIQKQVLSDKHPHLAISYGNIGLAYWNMGDYPKALSNYEQALTIQKKTLPDTHPHLAISYGNLGRVYSTMGDYSKVIINYEQALAIQKKILPSTHPDLVNSYGHLGLVYSKVGRFSEALSNYEEVLNIQKKVLPDSHPYLATSYENLGRVYSNMGKYWKAVLSFKQALAIRKKALPDTHPDLLSSYSHLGLAYWSMGEYSESLSYYQQVLAIQKKAIPDTHLYLATSYENIARVYSDMGEHSKAMSNYQKALAIRHKFLHATRVDTFKTDSLN